MTMSKKLEVIITRVKSLDNEELKKLLNIVEAELYFRDEKFHKSTESKENV